MTEAPKFGTSGLRGLATALTDEICAAYATAFAGMVDADSILIGEDLRDSSPRIVDAVAQGVARAGKRPVLCGVLPTPALALAARGRGHGAIMVTGSHIPGDRNGLKFYRGADEITKDDEAPLMARVDGITDAILPEDIEPERLDVAREQFIERYVRFFGAGTLKSARIGVWEHSSVARDILPPILQQLGAEVVSLDRSDSFVAVDTEAVSSDLRDRLRGWIATHDLDAIVSTDGDADRPLVVDETGHVIPGDILGPITARFLAADAIATPVSSNTMIDKLGFQTVTRTKIGSPYVIKAMEELSQEGHVRIAGYEPNGGFLLGYEAKIGARIMAPLLTRDFALPILATLADARERRLSLSELVTKLPGRRTATDRLTDVPLERSRDIVAAILEGTSDVLPPELGKPEKIDMTDGARMTFGGGEIVTIRPSGNAPELRAYVEAADDARAWGLLQDVLERLIRRIS